MRAFQVSTHIGTDIGASFLVGAWNILYLAVGLRVSQVEDHN